MQETERPPPYGMERDVVVKLPAVARDAFIHRDKIPTLEPLPSMLSSSPPQHPLDPSPVGPAARRHSGSYQTGPGTTLQPLQLPSVPSTELTPLPKALEAPRAMSVDSRRRDQSVSMEDPDDRMAAEALCGLGKVDSARLVRSPSGYEQPLKYYPMSIEHSRSTNPEGETEPILSLLTSSHPWLGGTINGSLSAYSSTKSHSPRFIQYSADFVERNIGSPVASTVGSVGRKTGVEESLRRYLARGANDVEHIDPEILGQESSNKRRRMSSEAVEGSVENFSIQRSVSGHASIDTLPVYDDNRSPAYEDTESSLSTSQRPLIPRSWSTQLMISTSGLGAALNDTSLRSLKHVLIILRSANTHVRKLMEALKKILSDYSTRRNGSPEQKLEEGTFLFEKNAGYNPQPHASETNATVAERINQLNAEIWKTLKSVVNTVSRYTGGALPENASVIVRWQLMSVPRRWQRASAAPAFESADEDGKQDEKEALNSANRMLAFAVEGIDMMEQVGGVVDSTILSAERWLETIGRKKERGVGTQSKQEGQSQERQGQDGVAVREEPVQKQGSEDVRMGEEDDDQVQGKLTEMDADNEGGREGEGMLIDTSS